MSKFEKWPFWVRIYARKERKNLLTQILGAVFGVLVVIIIDYLLYGEDLPVFLEEINLFRYFTILFVLVFHVLMIHSANNWIAKNSSPEHEDQFLSKWFSFLIGILIIVLFVLTAHYF